MSLNLEDLPVLAICGESGSGKTTLIERCVHHLRGQGLRVAVAKQSSRQLAIDQPGKDSARFFEAGADLLLVGQNGVFIRKQYVVGADFADGLRLLAIEHDIVLLEGYRHTPGPKVWLLAEGEAAPPADPQIMACLPRGPERDHIMLSLLDGFLLQRWSQPPVVGCVLIGGKSSRMGRPKHLLLKDGQTWLQRTASLLTTVSKQVVVAGGGELGDCPLPRLPDVWGCRGPLAGILAVMRWQPWATVLVTACDLPELTAEALSWLLRQRRPGAWAVLPKLEEYHQPLLALYDFRMRPALEDMAQAGIYRMSRLLDRSGVRVVSPPTELRGAWRNVNSPEMIALAGEAISCRGSKSDL